MSDLGQLLKKARTERGLSLDQLQETTKIRKRYLEAIEEGNFKILPGNFYVRAFIKSYSEAVGLEPEEVLRLYRNVIPVANPEYTIEPIRRKRRNSTSSDKFSKWASTILMWVFPLMIIGIIYYYFYSNYEGKDNTPDQPPITSHMNDSETGSDNDADNQEPVVEQEPEVKEPEPPAPIVAFISTEGDTDLYTAHNVDKSLVEMKVIGDACWVELRIGDGNGKALTSKVYKKGETAVWELDGGMWIRMGAPPALELKVNGVVLNTSGFTNPHNVQVNLLKDEQ